MNASNIPAGYKLVSGNAYGQDYVSLVSPSGTILVHAYEQGVPGMFAFLTALASAPSIAATRCACGDRLASECDEEWGPKCDLGNNAAHVQVSTVDPAVIDAAIAASPVVAHETPNASDNGACVQPAKVDRSQLVLNVFEASTHLGDQRIMASKGRATQEEVAEAYMAFNRAVGALATPPAAPVVAEPAAGQAGADDEDYWLDQRLDALAATPASPQAPAPQAVVGEAREDQESPAYRDFLKFDDHDAPSAAPHQGADALREALAELVACKDLKDAMRSYRSDPYYITEADRLETQYEQRQPLAWDRARAALAHHQAPRQGEQHE